MLCPMHAYDNASMNSFYRGMFQTEVVEKNKTHILCSVTFFSKYGVEENIWT